MGAAAVASGGSFLLGSLSSIRVKASASSSSPPSASSSSLPSASQNKERIEIKVCSSRTCRKQGSLDTVRVLSGISPPHVTVKSCGCLGRCGSGPNIVILPGGVFIGHCGTPSKAANVMAALCNVEDDDMAASCVKKCLEAFALRNRAEDEMGRGDFAQACSLLSQALDLQPFGGLHLIYKDRSVARLGMGDISGALEDATEAVILAPNYPGVHICKGDALIAKGHFEESEKSYSVALDLDPSVRHSKSFKARVAKLLEKLAPASSS